MANEHIVKSFDGDLAHINSMISEMGELVQAMLVDAIRAVDCQDEGLARQVIKRDKKLDAIELELGNFAIRTLALRQPMADDLRAVIVALKIGSNLERIGDYVKNISRRTRTLCKIEKASEFGGSVLRMANMVQDMINSTLVAYRDRDLELADAIRLRDQEVDEIYTSLFRELLTYMMEDPRNITPCTHFLFMAQSVERIGDHITTVVENIHFLVSGEMYPDKRPKSDKSAKTILEYPEDAE